MKSRWVPLALLGVFATAALSAQTKASGTVTCKADPATPVPVTDKPEESFMVGRAQCTWSGFPIAGVASKSGVSTDFGTMRGDTASFRGYHVATMANGDTTVAKYEGKATMKDGKPVSSEGTWVYEGGTGKFKGIKGKGTFKGKPAGDTTTFQIEGEYKLP